MENKKIEITIDIEVIADIKKVWEVLTEPKHIINWNFANEDWYCPKAENNLKVSEKFNYRMEAKDGSFGFNFWGTYTEIETYKKLFSILGDGRKLKILLQEKNGSTIITETFEAEDQNSIELQKNGWQSILNNLKKYTETL